MGKRHFLMPLTLYTLFRNHAFKNIRFPICFLFSTTSFLSNYKGRHFDGSAKKYAPTYWNSGINDTTR